MFRSAMLAAALMVATPVAAQERTVDLGDIRTVAGLLLQAGYKADIKAGKGDTPYILSGVNGSDFTLRFYNCKKDVECGSFEFFSYYKKQPHFTPELANEWNADKRFLKVAIDSDGDLVEYVYVSAAGKSTFKNFVDYVEWFAQMDGELAQFLKEKKALAEPAPVGQPDKTDAK